jgi:hypothetical protein
MGTNAATGWGLSGNRAACRSLRAAVSRLERVVFPGKCEWVERREAGWENRGVYTGAGDAAYGYYCETGLAIISTGSLVWWESQGICER